MFRRSNRLLPGVKIRVWQKSHTPWQIADLEPIWYLPYRRRKPFLLYQLTA